MKTVHVTNRLINRDSLSVGCLEPFSMCREGVGPPSTREQLVVRLVSFVLICFLLLPLTASAVVPPPDGGYPGGNTAEGQAALLNLTTGGFNTAIGWLSLRTNSTGQFNTAIGAGTLLANAGDENTATGAAALLSNTDGFANTANGVLALFSNTIGNGNTAIGVEALRLNDIGSGNTAVGGGALSSSISTDDNTAIGFAALANSTGDSNTATGFQALQNATGNSSTALGIRAGIGVTTANNVTCIGAFVAGANVPDSCFIGNIRGVTTQNADAVNVVIDSAGQLGTMSSSRQFKKEIKPMDKASEAVLALKPVTFHYKSDAKNMAQFGLIAEEVAEVDPDLVVRDKNGEIYSVRYEAVNAMLLNEFLKEHRKVQAQEATITQLKSTAEKQEATNAQQQKQIEALTAGLQKMSAQIEVSKHAPQVAVSNQ